MTRARYPFHIMAKPIGPICNLGCEYCYYLEKEQLYPHSEDFRMSDRALEQFVAQYIQANPGPHVDFAWQGGEPTLMGLDFFRSAVALQQKHLPPGWTCSNSLQTNGTLLNEQWCQFFRENRFLIGISIDGPAHLHDHYRVDKGQQPTHDRVMRGLRLLQSHGVEYNALCVVSRLNAEHPLEVYRFFKESGITWLQFIPLVEHLEDESVSDRSVSGEAYGAFLTAVFDEWVRNDVGRVFVQTFEVCLSVWDGQPASLCIFAETCGRGLALEHNGDVYACDHFVEPAYRLGNMQVIPVHELADSPAQVQFGLAKRDTLPRQCRECDVRFMCNGGCPKDRFLLTAAGEPGLNYLCDGYRRFFRYADPYFKEMVSLVRRRIHPARIMAELKAREAARWAGAGRNAPCPCGSGKKYKVCCLGRRASGETAG